MFWRNNIELNIDDLVHFFGVSDDNPTSFKFFGGEKDAILQGADYLKKKKTSGKC